MKTKLLLFLFLLSGAVAFAQYTKIPDAKFEAQLIKLKIDDVADGQVLTSKIATVTSLIIYSSSITDLTGIQDFIALETLDCDFNSLTSLDVSKNTLLQKLTCRMNKITAINLSNNTLLLYLDIYDNEVTTLDLSNNKSLTSLYCNSNQLTSLDITNNTNLINLSCARNQINTLDVTAHTSLETLECSYTNIKILDLSNNTLLTKLDCSDNKLLNLDVSKNTTLNFLNCESNLLETFDVSSNTALEYLISGNNGNLGNKYPVLDLSNNINLIQLNIFQVNITTLDLSKNINLKQLQCSSNRLSSLDLSNNTALEMLICANNKIQTLDLSKNTKLVKLKVDSNELTSLDLSNNTSLISLSAFNNKLNSLNLKNGNNSNFVSQINYSFMYFNGNLGLDYNTTYKNNPDLRCIKVDNEVYSEANWGTFKDPIVSYFTTVCSPYTLIPDGNFEDKLINLGIDSDGKNGKVKLASIATLTSLDVSNSNISDLTGIQNFVALQVLSCNNNNLQGLDLSENGSLTTLNTATNATLTCIKVADVSYANNNWITTKDATTTFNTDCRAYTLIPDLFFEQKLIALGIDTDGENGKVLTSNIASITSLNISNNDITDLTGIEGFTALTYLNAYRTKLTTLDLSKNKALQMLDCRYNVNLTSINLRNGTNNLITQNGLKLQDTPSLYCVLVDDVAFSSTNWVTSKDSWVNYSVACSAPQYTLIPDVEFEKVLIINGLDGTLDGKVLTARIAVETILDYSYTNHTKITDLTGIEGFTGLETLSTFATKITKLDVTKNIALKTLNCSVSDLTTLDLTNNVNLITVNCSANKLTTLDVSKNTQLTDLDFGSNNLTTINLSSNTALTRLLANNNKLTTLDLSKNLNLDIVNCGKNSFTTLDFSANTALTNILCYENKITTLDLTKNIALKSLNIDKTELSSLDLSKNTLLNTLSCNSNYKLKEVNLQNGNNIALTTISFKNNTILTCILVDDIPYSNANWSAKKDAWSSYSAVCKEPVYTIIPDAEFEKALIAFNYDVTLDGKVLTDNIAQIKTLNLTNYIEISDLTGIEDFTALESLKIGVSYADKLVKLNLTNNLALTTLQAIATRLTTLDLSKNTLLTTLDLSKSRNLIELNLQNQNNNFLDPTTLNLTGINSLACILVDNVAFSNTNWATKKDPWATFSIACTEPQYTLIPDVEFEKALLSSRIDTQLDGKVLTARIAVVKEIDYRYTNYQKITDLTGIEDFAALETLITPATKLKKLDVSKNTALKTLKCSSEDLTSLDVSNNKNLILLDISNNKLTTVDVSANLDLETLYVGSNKITSLDVQNNTKLTVLDLSFINYLKNVDLSKNTKLNSLNAYSTGLVALDLTTNTKLTVINCSNNAISALNVSNNPLLVTLRCDKNLLKSLNLKNGANTLLSSLNFTNNPSLTCIAVDDVSFSDANWSTYKDATASYNTDCTTYTLIPDANFEQQLINLGIDTDGKNGKVATDRIASILTLDVNRRNITDLTGIQDFTSLESLSVYNNELVTLDLSKNLKLITLEAMSSGLTSLDVSKNVALQNLYCYSNKLTTLDVSKNPNLKVLDCHFNDLTTLNLKNGNNTNFTDLNLSSKANLVCILVDDEVYSNANWSSYKDLNSTYSNACGAYTVIPDSNFEDELILLNIDLDGKNGKVLTSSIAGVKDLNVQISEIKDLTGIQGFAALETLNCQFNSISTLDLSKNLKLIELYAHGNLLTALDLSSNKVLTSVMCNKNQIENLDLSQNPNLIYIEAQENNLKTINLKNGNNINFTSALMFKNSALKCINVDNVAFATASTAFYKDDSASYSDNCELLGTDSSVINKAILYPNPTKGDVYITKLALEKATVYNSLGQLVRTFTLDLANTNNTINMAGLPKGIYYIYLIHEDAASAQKIIVE